MTILIFKIEKPLSQMRHSELSDLLNNLDFQLNRFTEFLGDHQRLVCNGEFLVDKETLQSIKLAKQQVLDHMKLISTGENSE